MATTEEHLVEIEQHLAKGHGEQPETLLSNLLNQMGTQELKDWELDIRRTIEQFQPRRRKRLLSLLEGALAPRSSKKVSVFAQPETDKAVQSLSLLEEAFRADLKRLSEFHIFQWTTFYRDTITPYFEQLLQWPTEIEAARIAQRCISEHAHQIFAKGFHHVTTQSKYAQEEATLKSMTGLARFLDIPVEYYSAHASSGLRAKDARRLRHIMSAVLYGILEGYGSTDFGGESGWTLLPEYPRHWAHYLAFLRAIEGALLAENIEPGEFCTGITDAVLPVLSALDQLASEHHSEFVPLPVLGQLLWEQRRLEIGVRPPADTDGLQLLEIFAYLSESYATAAELQASVARGASAIVARLKPDVEDALAAIDPTRKTVINADRPSAGDAAAAAVLNALDDAIYRLRSPRAATNPLSYNVAREFPLRNPFRAKYFHVPRLSVRDLLRTFERRNGVRLWCSVRRSGKTTACFDLGSTTGTSTVVSQTCDSTEQFPGSHLFYDEVLKAIDAGHQLPNSFFESLVARCAPTRTQTAGRYVFVIDEYETLFGRLRGAIRRDQDLRYTVIQPLLNQMVAFTRDHLLVFMGQQPNAHHILMDQNQLSAYVEQDSFPLFQHTLGTTTGEYAEFVRKVLTERINVDAGFMDALFCSAAGHPFLTVNLLVEIIDWVIETKRPAKGLRLRREDFTNFAIKGLTSRRLSLSPEYDFFRAAVSDALSEEGMRQNPWLHSVYACLRQMARHAPESLALSHNEFTELAETKVGVEKLGFSADEILRTRTQANFFAWRENEVSIRIPILGSLAAVTRPRVS